MRSRVDYYLDCIRNERCKGNPQHERVIINETEFFMEKIPHRWGAKLYELMKVTNSEVKRSLSHSLEQFHELLT